MLIILTQVDFATGNRACGLRPGADDGYLVFPQHQDFHEGWEVGMVFKDLPSDHFANMEGVRVFESEQELEDFIKSKDKDMPPQYNLVDSTLMVESLKAKGVDLSKLDHTIPTIELYKQLYEDYGALGIDKHQHKIRRKFKINDIAPKLPPQHKKELRAWQSSRTRPNG